MSGFNPSPSTFGAEAGHIEEVILDSLLDSDGTAFAKDVDSFVYAERFAEARAIAYLWHLNEQLAKQWDRSRATVFLSRWEAIDGVTPLAGATDADRRAALVARLAAWMAPPTLQVVRDFLQAALGSVFTGLVPTSSAQAVGSVPGGATIPGGVTLPDGPWTSSVAHIAIGLAPPASMPDYTFYALAGQVAQAVDDLLPAWATWDWFRDGASGAGFVLDDPHNLDNERFDS
jgi:hypothetical protein